MLWVVGWNFFIKRKRNWNRHVRTASEVCHPKWGQYVIYFDCHWYGFFLRLADWWNVCWFWIGYSTLTHMNQITSLHYQINCVSCLYTHAGLLCLMIFVLKHDVNTFVHTLCRHSLYLKSEKQIFSKIEYIFSYFHRHSRRSFVQSQRK